MSNFIDTKVQFSLISARSFIILSTIASKGLTGFNYGALLKEVYLDKTTEVYLDKSKGGLFR